jgi:hypothetical protein
MCYEESFFRSWARKRAQRSEKPETVVERRTPEKPAPAPSPTPGKPAATPSPRKETERELEIV